MLTFTPVARRGHLGRGGWTWMDGYFGWRSLEPYWPFCLGEASPRTPHSSCKAGSMHHTRINHYLHSINLIILHWGIYIFVHLKKISRKRHFCMYIVIWARCVFVGVFSPLSGMSVTPRAFFINNAGFMMNMHVWFPRLSLPRLSWRHRWIRK